MAGRTAIHVDGARQLRSSLKRAGLSVQDLKDAHKAVADLVLAAADPPVGKTRQLSGSQRAAGTQREAVVRAGGARVRYAGPVHWGWPARNVTAQPWLWEAARKKEDAALDQYLAALERIIQTIEGTHP